MAPHHCALLTEKVISPVQNQHQNSWHTNLGRTIDSAHVPPRLRSKKRHPQPQYDGVLSRTVEQWLL